MSFVDTWPKATVDGSNNNDPPAEGAYELALIGASAFVSKKGNEIVKLEFEVVSQVENGYQWTEVRGFGSQGQANAAKATCHGLGVDTDQVVSLEQLDGALKERIGGYYGARIVRNGEYLNTYIDGAVAGRDPRPPEPAAVPTGSDFDDEDIPF
jgi:hypothetical protein